MSQLTCLCRDAAAQIASQTDGDLVPLVDAFETRWVAPIRAAYSKDCRIDDVSDEPRFSLS